MVINLLLDRLNRQTLFEYFYYSRNVVVKDSKFGMPNTVKYLKISVFGGSRWYMVIFGFANSHFQSIWYF